MKKKTIKKYQAGKQVTKGQRPGMGLFKTESERTTVGGVAEPYKFTRTSVDTTGYSKGKPSFEVKTAKGEGDKVTGPKVTSTTSRSVSRDSVLKTVQKKGGTVKSKSKSKKK